MNKYTGIVKKEKMTKLRFWKKMEKEKKILT